MCGSCCRIAGIVLVRISPLAPRGGPGGVTGRRRLQPTREALARMAGALDAPRPRRVRDLPRRRAGSRTRASRSSIWHGAAAALERGRHAVDRVQRRDLQLRRAARGARGPGARFRTKSDTEVIVHAWEAWGDAAFARFNGQWAVALWDERSARLVLARDRLGVRPLHVTEHGGRVFFASEVKAIFAADPSIPRARPHRPRSDVHVLEPSCRPRTVFAGVRSSARARAHLRARRSRERAYRAPGCPEEGRRRQRLRGQRSTRPSWRARRSRGDAPAHGARRRARGQLPLGRARQLARGGARPRGEGRELLRPSRCASRTPSTTRPSSSARWCAARDQHHEIVVSRATSPRPSPRSSPRRAARSADGARAALLAVEARARRGIKVVLTGEGADEMFAGYDLFREGKVRRFWARAARVEVPARCCSSALPVPRALAPSRSRPSRRVLRARPRAGDAPGFAHDLRWRTAAALKRLFSAERARARGRRRRRASCSRRCPRSSALEPPRPGSVPRDPHAALGLPALFAGRSHADGRTRSRGASPSSTPTSMELAASAARVAQAAACSTRSTC
jgi:asparagine synthase (glutamine-hydrolysing)